MKININSTDLLKALEIIKPVMSGSVVPVCENVFFKVTKEDIILKGTNTHHSIITTFPCESEEKGELLIPFNDIWNLCRLLPACPILISTTSDGIEVSCDTGLYNITSTDKVIDFLKIPLVDEPIHTAVITGSVVEKLRDKILKFVHPDSMITSMHGVGLDFVGERLNIVALDGCVMSVLRVLCESDKDVFFFVQKKAIELMSIFSKNENLTLKFDSQRFQVQSESTVLVTSLINDNFPNYKNLILDHAPFIIVDKEEILQSLQRAKQFSGVSSVGLVISAETIEVFADNFILGKGFSESHKLFDSKGIEDKIQIGFNIKYLIDGINACDSENIMIFLKDGKTPIIINEAEDTAFSFQAGPCSYQFN